MKARALLGMAASLLVSLACSQIVGIADTDVTRGAGVDSAAGGSSGLGASGKNATAAGQSNHGGAGNAAAGGSAAGDAPHAGATSDGGTPAAGGDTSVGGSSSGGSQAGGGAGGSGGAAVLHGPKLISIGNYAVDATEVTVAHYKEFLSAKAGDTSGQAPSCSWNKSYYEAAPMPLEPDTWPIAKVDWCDATAFCAWAGKRLCGAIGGGASDFADFGDATKSQWLRACGGPTGLPHPNPSWACNEKGGFSDVAPVATFPDCEGFYPGLFDLEGNVGEWVDSCDGSSGKADHCQAAGGSELDQTAYCTQTADDLTRDFTSHYFGFRCCSK